MQITELKGNNLKKSLGLTSVSFRYHNKNKSGGNFAINFLKNGNYGDKDYFGFELSGDYNTSGELLKLDFSKIYQAGYKLFMPITYEDLIKRIRELMPIIEQEDKNVL